ncbi:MAG TPA: DHH family phosphoesterase [Tepidisphaeraceae bacterium]|jgi:phosphoesterase RecJ-like protein
MPDTAAEVLNVLSNSRRVLVTTHVRPDGDALGSTAAMVRAMKVKGIAADVLLLSKLPSKYAFVYVDAGIESRDVEAGFPADFSLDPYDTLLVIDTGTWSQLPGLKPYVEQFKGKKLVVDHHLTQEDWADTKHVLPKAAAAGEIVADLIEQWGVAFDAPMASALYVALVADTGWFQYSNTGPATLRLAARLMEAGVDTDRVYQLLYQNERPQRLALHARGLNSMELVAGGKVAVMTLDTGDFVAADASVNDTEALINTPLQIRNVAASVVLSRPPGPGPVRISFRSKGQIDVAAFAQQFGGGGHARAAGAKLDGSLYEAKATIIAKLTEAFA